MKNRRYYLHKSSQREVFQLLNEKMIEKKCGIFNVDAHAFRYRSRDLIFYTKKHMNDLTITYGSSAKTKSIGRHFELDKILSKKFDFYVYCFFDWDLMRVVDYVLIDVHGMAEGIKNCSIKPYESRRDRRSGDLFYVYDVRQLPSSIILAFPAKERHTLRLPQQVDLFN